MKFSFPNRLCNRNHLTHFSIPDCPRGKQIVSIAEKDVIDSVMIDIDDAFVLPIVQQSTEPEISLSLPIHDFPTGQTDSIRKQQIIGLIPIKITDSQNSPIP